MAEMERLKADEKSFKAFATLRDTTKDALEKAYDAVKNDVSDDMDTS
jgi:hypothetical protein